MSTEDWFAVQVRAGRERFCAEHLQARGYEVFLPCYYEQRRWSDRLKTTERALFAGYLFCRFGRTVTAKVVTTPAVIRIVGNSQGPQAVPSHEIEAVRGITAARLAIEPWPFEYQDRLVRVDCGPLRGLLGTVLQVKNRHRLVISVSLLQRSLAVEIAPEWVSIAQTSDAATVSIAPHGRFPLPQAV